jgi:hypothetical protein
VRVDAVGFEVGQSVAEHAQRLGDQQHPDAERVQCLGLGPGADREDDRSGGAEHHQQVDRDGRSLRFGESERVRLEHWRRILRLAQRNLDVDHRLVGHDDHHGQGHHPGDGREDAEHDHPGQERLRGHEFEEHHQFVE